MSSLSIDGPGSTTKRSFRLCDGRLWRCAATNFVATSWPDRSGSRRVDAWLVKRHLLWELAILYLKLGCLAFGGPAAHIAIMEDEVVRRRRWMSQERPHQIQETATEVSRFR